MSATDIAPIDETTADRLIEEWIQENPHHPGRDDVRVCESGVPVWALIGYLRAAGGDIDRVAADYDLPRDAVLAAIAYYQRHTAIVDARIDANAVRAT